jgi:hypothetical protein
VVVILESGKGLKGGVVPGLKFFYKRNATHRWAENFAGAVSHVPTGVPGFCEFGFFVFFFFFSLFTSDKIATTIKLFTMIETSH